jgi:hypothetical protein
MYGWQAHMYKKLDLMVHKFMFIIVDLGTNLQVTSAVM